MEDFINYVKEMGLYDGNSEKPPKGIKQANDEITLPIRSLWLECRLKRSRMVCKETISEALQQCR